MVRFTESGLHFDFDTPWTHVQQWDRQPAFIHGVRRFSSTGAVDFIGLCGSDLYLIEVKSFRAHRIENKDKFTSGALVAHIADKVRDTIAGLVWAMGREHASPELVHLLRQIFANGRKCKVVFWLEEDRQPRPADRSVLGLTIKQRLRWLNPHVILLSRRDPALPGLVVMGDSAEG